MVIKHSMVDTAGVNRRGFTRLPQRLIPPFPHIGKCIGPFASIRHVFLCSINTNKNDTYHFHCLQACRRRHFIP